MSRTLKISLVMLTVLSLLFALVWVTIYQQFQELSDTFPEVMVAKRLFFMGLTVFLSAFAFFRLNFWWSHRHKGAWNLRTIGPQVLSNILLAIAIAGIIHWISVVNGDIGEKSFFVLLTMRNTGLAFVSFLVSYAYDISERSKLDKIKLLGLKNEKMEAELGALKAQVDPHFLFNSLNSLTGVIRENQKEAIQFVNHLSQTMRYTLEKRDVNLVTLKEELQFLGSYEYMMKIRFGEGFVIQTNVPSSGMGAKLPQFALQLLVENAIKHNRVSLKSPLNIRIEMEEEHLKVVNNYQPKASVPKGYGFGLASLSQRYELLGMPPVEINRSETEFSVRLSLT